MHAAMELIDAFVQMPSNERVMYAGVCLIHFKHR